MDYHTLVAADLENAKLYANRYDMVKALCNKNGVYIEIGVAFGDFSRFVIDNCHFQKHYLVDIFTLDEQEYLWGKRREEVFGDLTHEQFVRERFKNETKQGSVEIIRSDSVNFLENLPADFADLTYIDGDHSYLGVLNDSQLAPKSLKDEGYLVFNDYILYDHIAHSELGVVPVVNDLCKSGEWKITHFGLEKNMFCDVALRRI